MHETISSVLYGLLLKEKPEESGNVQALYNLADNRASPMIAAPSDLLQSLFDWEPEDNTVAVLKHRSLRPQLP